MEKYKKITAIDSHTGGETNRIIIDGMGFIPGENMAEKKKFLQEERDWIRTAVLLEPRGHSEMFGSILLKPTQSEADLGIVFMDSKGYLNMCGHGTLAALVAAVEFNLVEVVEPITNIKLETPAGLVQGEVHLKERNITFSSFVNVPAFLQKENLKIYISELKKDILVDISFGGSFFALVDAEKAGVSICGEESSTISRIGMAIMQEVNRVFTPCHPQLSHIKTVDLVEFYNSENRNVVVFGNGQLDRSPCGTGTCAKMAALYYRGKLGIGEEFFYHSIIGTKFRGRILDAYEEDGVKYILPEISAKAYITGINHILIDKDDPLGNGFSIGEKNNV
ncbi:MAG: proline racemase family protein [Fusobacteriaceae bacterium]